MRGGAVATRVATRDKPVAFWDVTVGEKLKLPSHVKRSGELFGSSDLWVARWSGGEKSFVNELSLSHSPRRGAVLRLQDQRERRRCGLAGTHAFI